MVKFTDIEDAFLFVSSDSYGMNTAILDKATGQVYYRSEMGGLDEINQDELDWDNCIQIPHKNDLDLGQELVFEFVEDHLPDEYDRVRQIFRGRGAYGRFKDLLESRGLLQSWYDFENGREQQALRQWCEENGIEISIDQYPQSMSDEGQPVRPADTWAMGEAYDPYMGRWSRRVAAEFVPWLEVPAGSDWLDVGCGTGGLSQTILELAKPHSVKGIDRSDGFIAFARAQTPDARIKFEVGDAQELPVETGAYDAVVSGLMLNFVPQPDRTVAEMARAACPGGVVAAYVWDYAGKMQLMEYFWSAAAALDPEAAHLDEWRRFPLCYPDPLRQLFQGAGLHEVEVRAIEIATDFRDFDDYWSPFLGGQGPAPSYAMALSPEHRAALRDRLRITLPFASDGSIPLAARAWSVRGRRHKADL